MQDPSTRKVILDKKDEFEELEILEPLQKKNLPFYYVKPQNIQKLKRLG